uniref:ATP synthase complex subunit 8 n=1 Tax=Stenotoxodera porioni TaxID=444995 RepID=A0A343UML5_9NEOP|nr:ATP synthase F0 subunit 8 [Stenotoxodera porioni]
MPQMMPLNWLMLFTFFFLLLFLLNMLNYYTISNKKLKDWSKKQVMSLLNWKW